MGLEIISLRGGFPFLPGPLEISVFADVQIGAKLEKIEI